MNIELKRQWLDNAVEYLILVALLKYLVLGY